MIRQLTLSVIAASALVLVGSGNVSAGQAPAVPQVQAPFDDFYEVLDLGPAPGVPVPYGGVTFLDPDTLLIGGDAGAADAAIYTVGLVRDGDGTITGFAGPAERLADAPYIDGGLAHGPSGVLFYTRYRPGLAEIGEIKPGSDTTDRVIDLTSLGVTESPGGLNFVPSGFPGAGTLKLTSYDDGGWYEIALAAAGDGTFEATSAAKRADLRDGLESFSFVPVGSPAFGQVIRWALINEFDDAIIGAYELGEDGDATGPRQVFMTGLGGPEGSVFDSISGNLVVSDYGNDRLYSVSGFTPGTRILPPFHDDYQITEIGGIEPTQTAAVPGLPMDYGGITFMQGDPDTVLIGGDANEEDAALYSIGVTRDQEDHITGFSGQAQVYATAPFIDGGLAYGPQGVLVFSRYNPGSAEIGQIKPGSSAPDKVNDIAAAGVAETPGALNFVPQGLPGTGEMKIVTYEEGLWYELDIEPAGDGTFDVTDATMRADLPDGLEGFVYVPPESPEFEASPSILLLEYDDDGIAAYQIDANGDPVPGTRRPFAAGLDGPVGAAFDPLTNDLIVTEFSSARVYRISGFASPAPAFLKGDNNCDVAIDVLDALTGLQFVAGLPPVQEPDCPMLGSQALIASRPSGLPAVTFGDIDCDTDVDAVDSLLILTFVAGLPVDLPQGCAPLEQPS